jgi:hypothetical protein
MPPVVKLDVGYARAVIELVLGTAAAGVIVDSSRTMPPPCSIALRASSATMSLNPCCFLTLE